MENSSLSDPTLRRDDKVILSIIDRCLSDQSDKMLSLVSVDARYVLNIIIEKMGLLCNVNDCAEASSCMFKDILRKVAIDHKANNDDHTIRCAAIIHELLRNSLILSDYYDLTIASDGMYGCRDQYPVLKEIGDYIVDAISEDDFEAWHEWAVAYWEEPSLKYPPLPQLLDTEYFKRILDKALDKGLMEIIGDDYVWNKSDRLLVYFAKEVSEHLGLSTNGTKWKPFKEMFNTKINMSSISANMDNLPEGSEMVDDCLI